MPNLIYSAAMTLKETIRNSGFRQNWLAAQIGVQQSAMSDFVRGVRSIPIEKLAALAKIMRVSTDALVKAYTESKSLYDQTKADEE